MKKIKKICEKDDVCAERFCWNQIFVGESYMLYTDEDFGKEILFGSCMQCDLIRNAYDRYCEKIGKDVFLDLGSLHDDIIASTFIPKALPDLSDSEFGAVQEVFFRSIALRKYNKKIVDTFTKEQMMEMIEAESEMPKFVNLTEDDLSLDKIESMYSTGRLMERSECDDTNNAFGTRKSGEYFLDNSDDIFWIWGE